MSRSQRDHQSMLQWSVLFSFSLFSLLSPSFYFNSLLKILPSIAICHLLLSEYIRNFHYNYRLCHYLSSSLLLLSLLLLLYYYHYCYCYYYYIIIVVVIIIIRIIIIIIIIVVVSLFVYFRHCGYYDMVKKASARKWKVKIRKSE
jgi:hypothetical protein